MTTSTPPLVVAHLLAGCSEIACTPASLFLYRRYSCTAVIPCIAARTVPHRSAVRFPTRAWTPTADEASLPVDAGRMTADEESTEVVSARIPVPRPQVRVRPAVSTRAEPAVPIHTELPASQ